MAFMKGFMQFLPDRLEDEHAWLPMQAFVKGGISAHGRSPYTVTVVAQDWATLDDAFIQNLPNLHVSSEERGKLEHAYTFGYLENKPQFHQYRAEARARAMDQANRVLETMQFSTFFRHSKLEVAYAFPEWLRDPAQNPHEPLRAPQYGDPDVGSPMGLCTLAITQARGFPNSVAFDVVGTDSSINRFVDELKMVGLHARVYS
ncbi:hypothetical protein D3C71_79230 [compost metagenome]